MAEHNVKTIMARFQQIKNMEGDFGKTLAAMEAVNVEVYTDDTKTELRDVSDMLEDLAVKWNDVSEMTDVQKKAVSSALGIRQINRFSALMQGLTVATGESTSRFDELGESVNISLGEVERQYSHFDRSIEAASNRMKNAWQDAFSDLLSSDGLKSIYHLSGEVAKGFTALIPAISLMAESLVEVFDLVVALAKPIFNLALAIDKTVGIVTILKIALFSIIAINMTKTFLKMSLAIEAFAAKTVIASTAISTMAISETAAAFGFLKVAIVGATKALWGFIAATVKFMFTPLGAALTVLIGAIGLLTYKISQNARELKEQEEAAKAAAEAKRELIKQTRELADALQEETDKTRSLEEKVSEYEQLVILEEQSAEQKERIADLQQQIAGYSDALITKYTSEGIALSDNIEVMKEYIALRKEESKKELTDAISAREEMTSTYEKVVAGKDRQVAEYDRYINMGGITEVVNTKNKYGGYDTEEVFRDADYFRTQKSEYIARMKEYEDFINETNAMKLKLKTLYIPVEVEIELSEEQILSELREKAVEKQKAFEEMHYKYQQGQISEAELLKVENELIQAKKELREKTEEYSDSIVSTSSEINKSVRLSAAEIGDLSDEIMDLSDKQSLSVSETERLFEIQETLRNQYNGLREEQARLANQSFLTTDEQRRLAEISMVLNDINVDLIDNMTDLNFLNANAETIVASLYNADKKRAEFVVNSKLRELRLAKLTLEASEMERQAHYDNIEAMIQASNMKAEIKEALIAENEEMRHKLDYEKQSELNYLTREIDILQKFKDSLPDFYKREEKDVYDQHDSSNKKADALATDIDRKEAELFSLQIRKSRIMEELKDAETIEEQAKAYEKLSEIQLIEIKLLDDLYKLQIREANSLGEGTKARLDMLKAAEKTKESIWMLRDEIEDNTTTVYELYRDRAVEIMEEQADLVEDARAKILDIIEESIEREKDLLDDSLNDFKSAAEKAMDALDSEQKEREQKREHEKLLSERAEIEKKINNLSMIDTIKSRTELSKLQEELREKDLQILEFHENKALEIAKDKIQQQIEEQEALTEKAKDEIDERWTEEKKQAEATKALARETFETASGIISNVGDMYQNFTDVIGSSSRQAILEIQKLMNAMMVLDAEAHINKLSYEQSPQYDGTELTSDNGSTVPVRAFLEKFLGIEGDFAGDESQRRIQWDGDTREIVVDGDKRISTDGMELINDRMYSSIELLKKAMSGAGFRNGGVIDQDGLTVVHGAKRREYLFNTEQYKDLAKFILEYSRDFSHKMLDSSNSKNSEIIIENFLNVEGNVDKSTISSLQAMQDEALFKLNNMINKGGVRTTVG